MDCFNPCSWSHRKFEIKNCEEKKVEGIFSHYALFFVHFEVVFLSFRSFDLVEGKGEKKKGNDDTGFENRRKAEGR